MEELYKPIFYPKEMPKEGYVPKSFARVVVLEALYFTSINWMRLAAEKWRIGDAPCEIILYKEGREQLTYQSVVLNNLKTGIQRMQNGLKLLEVDEDIAKKNIAVVQNLENALTGAEFKKKNEEVLKKLKVKLKFELENLEIAKKRTETLCADLDDVDL